MPQRKLSKEELFALVWEKPTSEIASELGLSEPPRGYWARMQAGQRPRKPSLLAFREELEAKRRDEQRERSAESLSKLQREFLELALLEINSKSTGTAPLGPRPLVDIDLDIAAQALLIIQGKARAWVEEGRIATRWGPPVRNTVSRLIERLLPLAREQLVVFETESKRTSFRADGPVIFIRLTKKLQERIAGLASIVRGQELQHVVRNSNVSSAAGSFRNLVASPWPCCTNASPAVDYWFHPRGNHRRSDHRCRSYRGLPLGRDWTHQTAPLFVHNDSLAALQAGPAPARGLLP